MCCQLVTWPAFVWLTVAVCVFAVFFLHLVLGAGTNCERMWEGNIIHAASSISMVLTLLPTLEGISSWCSLHVTLFLVLLFSGIILVFTALLFLWSYSCYFQLAAADFFVVIGIESERNIYLHGCRKSYFTFIFERQFCFYIICNLELSVSC